MVDHIVEPIKDQLIPHFDEIKENVLKNNAIGCSISGSGPSIFALSENKQNSMKILSEMQNIYNKYNVKYHGFIQKINNKGIEVL